MVALESSLGITYVNAGIPDTKIARILELEKRVSALEAGLASRASRASRAELEAELEKAGKKKKEKED